MPLSPLNQRRWRSFRQNRRGFLALWLFLVLYGVSLFAEFIANDQPVAIRYDSAWYFPVFTTYSERTFGGDMNLDADYTDPYITDLIAEKGHVIWPLIPFSHDTIDFDLDGSPPTPPDRRHWLGTDDQGRDVLARVIHGFRISVSFGLLLTLFSTVIGVAAGAVQGYFGGLLDLVAQRFIEIWQGLPVLYLLIIMASVIAPGFMSLLVLMTLFGWTALVGVVRAEFLRARNFEYVRAARALGVADLTIMWRHTLPNAMVATVTFLPFILSGSVTTLTGLDFLGLGLPPGSASLGEMLKQGRDNLSAPWLGLTAFIVLALMLSLLVFVGEAIRDALDPRKTFAVSVGAGAGT
ncbi:MAG: ABC transporter permease [Gammaproteobacteria bacterium]|nr:MAG: ABC transporter permease [Gammaproteobacteria bacterium]